MIFLLAEKIFLQFFLCLFVSLIVIITIVRRSFLRIIGYRFILIIVGGLMILFLYFVGICSNEEKINVDLRKIRILILIIFLYDEINEGRKVIKNISLCNEKWIFLFTEILFLVIFLLIILFFLEKILGGIKGSLRIEI